MINISMALNAKVRGDDFEYYDETYFTNGGYPITGQQSESPADKQQVKKKAW